MLPLKIGRVLQYLKDFYKHMDDKVDDGPVDDDIGEDHDDDGDGHLWERWGAVSRPDEPQVFYSPLPATILRYKTSSQASKLR